MIGVHSLHLWSLSAPVVCLTVHLTIKVRRNKLDFITIIGKNKLGDDIEGVRTRAAAMLRAKHVAAARARLGPSIAAPTPRNRWVLSHSRSLLGAF